MKLRLLTLPYNLSMNLRLGDSNSEMLSAELCGARVKALLKRYRIATSQTVQIGPLSLNRKTYECRMGDREIALPPKEFELLFKLASYPGKTFTRDELIEQIWGYDYEGDERTVDVHIKRLRERFAHPDAPFLIRTIRGLGYRLEACR